MYESKEHIQKLLVTEQKTSGDLPIDIEVNEEIKTNGEDNKDNDEEFIDSTLGKLQNLIKYLKQNDLLKPPLST